MSHRRFLRMKKKKNNDIPIEQISQDVKEHFEETIEEHVEDIVVEEPIEETIEEHVEDVVKDTIEEHVEDVVEDTIEEHVEDVVEDVVENVVEDVVEDVVEEPFLNFDLTKITFNTNKSFQICNDNNQKIQIEFNNDSKLFFIYTINEKGHRKCLGSNKNYPLSNEFTLCKEQNRIVLKMNKYITRIPFSITNNLKIYL